MPLVEYLYVDTKRLDSYVEQICSPVKYDKVPVWNAELSVFGPKAVATQERHARKLTQHEKIEILRNHLNDGGFVAAERPSNRDCKDFVLETCRATQIIIPAEKGQLQHSGLRLWVSESLKGPEYNPRTGLLCLLEDYSRSDEEAPVYAPLCRSAYTVLESLLSSVLAHPRSTILVDLSFWEHADAFITDPLAKLHALGCSAGGTRSVETLYRVREFGEDDFDETRRVTTFGYPIYIAAK